MSDHIIRAITADGSVKAVAITGRDLVERARTIHTLLPVATAALGRTLLAASMMGDMLKEDNGALTLQIKGGGPLGTILAVSDCGGNVRGYVQDPHVELMEKVPGKLDVGAAVGTDGSLTVIKDLGLKEPYIGSIGLFSGEIADDLALYFVESEQIPTACALGVLVGVGVSIRWIRAALRRNRAKMLYFILGLMAGALYAIVMGPTTLSPPQQALHLETFHLGGFVLGVGILIGLERLKLLIARREARAEKTEDGTQGEEEAQSGGSPQGPA